MFNQFHQQLCAVNFTQMMATHGSLTRDAKSMWSLNSVATGQFRPWHWFKLVAPDEALHRYAKH